jgi:hypothetical protein
MTFGPTRATNSYHSRVYGTVSYEGERHTVPSPLAGEGQGEGYNRHRRCFAFGAKLERSAKFAYRGNFSLRAMSPPLSLSLPRKEGENRGARIFATHDQRARKP